MEFRLEKLGANYIKQEEPACAVCGYTAAHIMKIGGPGKDDETVRYIVKMFCELDLRDALLDAFNFSASVPDVLPLEAA